MDELKSVGMRDFTIPRVIHKVEECTHPIVTQHSVQQVQSQPQIRKWTSTFAALRAFSFHSCGHYTTSHTFPGHYLYFFLLPLFFTIFLITTRKHDAARSVSQWCSPIPSIHSLGMHVHATVSACTPIVPLALTLNSNRNSAQCTSSNNLSIAAQKI